MKPLTWAVQSRRPIIRWGRRRRYRFIVANKDKNIQLQFIGDRTYKTAMQPNDRKAIAELTELARILSGMEQIRKDKKEANLKIEFVTRKMQEQEEEK